MSDAMLKNSVREDEMGYMNIVVRDEGTKGYRRTEEVTREALRSLYFPGTAGHYVVHQMRSHTDFIPELAFVIEVDGIVEGAIFYIRSKIVTGQGEFPTINFGPVLVPPKYHRQGLGRNLITHSIQKAREMGYSTILILGYPYHYEPYGFYGGKKSDIAMADGRFYKGLLVLPLRENALHGKNGYVVFSGALEAKEKDILNFDATFPQKEKKVLLCQQEYEIAYAMLNE